MRSFYLLSALPEILTFILRLVLKTTRYQKGAVMIEVQDLKQFVMLGYLSDEMVKKLIPITWLGGCGRGEFAYPGARLHQFTSLTVCSCLLIIL